MPTTAYTPNSTSAEVRDPDCLPPRDQATPPPVAPPPDHGVCDACRTPGPGDALVRTLAGDRICQACQRDNYWRCGDCGGWNPDGYTCGNYCDDTDDTDDTDEDDEDDDEPDDLVRDYGYKPYPVFHGTGPLFLGLELELATPTGRRPPARLAVATLDRLGYLKADDSIGGGFELVTHPMSYPWALAHFPWSLLPALADAGAQASDRCGLHVHLSRAGFAGPPHVYRWMKFIYRNQRAVTALARRDSDSWARFDDDDRGRVKAYAKGSRGYYRHRAINTQNDETFELRIFASTLHPAHVQAALGFAAATVDYTRTLTIPAITRGGGWAWPAFTGWVTTRPRYAPLLEQIHALTGTLTGTLAGTRAGSTPCAC